MLLSLLMRDTFYLFDCYLAFHTYQWGSILLVNVKYYPMLSSPQIWIDPSAPNFTQAEYT